MYTIEEIDNVTRNEKVVDIYGTYYETIAPAIFRLETLDGAFPVEILNEVRSIFTHISRCCITDDIHVYEDNINKAQRHTKRAVLDCYKYLCVSYDEHFKRFEELYANVDLSVIDNGSFLPELKKRRKSAVELILKAKQFDLEGKNEDELYTAYEDAYHAFYDLYKLIEDSYDKLSRAKKLSNKKDIMAIVGVIGIAVSVFLAFGINVFVITMYLHIKKKSVPCYGIDFFCIDLKNNGNYICFKIGVLMLTNNLIINPEVNR